MTSNPPSSRRRSIAPNASRAADPSRLRDPARPPFPPGVPLLPPAPRPRRAPRVPAPPLSEALPALRDLVIRRGSLRGDPRALGSYELALDEGVELPLANVQVRRDDKEVFDALQAWYSFRVGHRLSQWDVFALVLAEAMSRAGASSAS